MAGSTPAKIITKEFEANRLEKEFKTASDDRKKEIVDKQNDEVVQAFHDACIKITDKIDIKGYALVAWDQKGVPCISWSTGHVDNPISELMLPTFTHSIFQSIVSKKISTTEDLKND